MRSPESRYSASPPSVAPPAVRWRRAGRSAVVSRRAVGRLTHRRGTLLRPAYRRGIGAFTTAQGAAPRRAPPGDIAALILRLLLTRLWLTGFDGRSRGGRRALGRLASRRRPRRGSESRRKPRLLCRVRGCGSCRRRIGTQLLPRCRRWPGNRCMEESPPAQPAVFGGARRPTARGCSGSTLSRSRG